MKKISSILYLLSAILMFLPACKNENNTPEEPTDPTKDAVEYAYIQGKSAKRGVSFGWQLDSDFDLLGSAVSWSYN